MWHNLLNQLVDGTLLVFATVPSAWNSSQCLSREDCKCGWSRAWYHYKVRKSYFQWRVHWNFVHWSLFSMNGFTENAEAIFYFQWRVHWNNGHWNLFSVNSFAEHEVKIAECYAPYRSVSGLLISLSLAVQPVGGYTTDHVMLGLCKARPTVTFPAQSTATEPWPVLISIRNEGRRLSQPSGWLDTEVVYR